jgi:corrinoid protein of di/trimethylamine methyltransferase
MEETLKGLKQAILDLNESEATRLARRAVTERVDLAQALESCGEGLKEIGIRFEHGDIFLPELVKSGQVMQAVTAILEPSMKQSGKRPKVLGRVVVGTVQGDVHDIGKNILAVMLLLEGFEVHDLGKNVPAEEFIDEAEKVGAEVVAVSALLTTTMIRQKEVIEAFVARGLREKVVILVGGSPVTPAWAEAIGADGYAENAVEGVKVARKLTDRSRG